MSASIETYRNINLETANPRDTIVKLYNAAIRLLTEAETGLGDGQRADEPLGKARQIVGGLMASLNFDAGDLSKNLFQLYLFVLDRVQTSSIENKDAGLAEARRVLEILKAGWEEVRPEATQVRGRPGPRPNGLDLKG